MDSLRKLRRPIRAAITRNGNLLEIELAKEQIDQQRIEVLYAILEEKWKELDTADHNIQEALLQDEVSDEDYARECEEIDSYKETLITYRHQVNAIYRNPAPSVYDDAVSTTGSSKKKFRLPKLELQKFGGDLKDWLCFWSLFKKIHEDEEVDPEDKFQYLLQAIIPGSRARELIDSYPPTAANYPKVVESLKQRFGRDDLLVEVYVRELLRLVLQNAMNPQEKVGVTKLYDQLESHIRALDTLGVTSDKCAAMLYPLVESCLPEEVLRAWQRGAAITNATEDSDPSKNRLSRLLQFLRSEVEGEERIRLARAGFGIKTKNEKAAKEVAEDVPTAAGLLSGDGQSVIKSLTCIFCEKKHLSQECFQAQKITMPERKSCLQKRRGCFVCLRIGHMGKDCRQLVQCIICSQKHFPILCPELPQKSNQSNKESNAEAQPALANISSSPDVLLKTLLVKIGVGDNQREARVVIDDGSHRSYVLKHLAEDMGMKEVGAEPIIHALFGGSKSGLIPHKRYEVSLMSLDSSFSCVVKMLDQQTICSSIPKVPRGPWLSELKRRKIWISDVGSDCPPIDILIGADIAAKLMTGRICHLRTGLVAIETKLGWTLMGEVPGGESSETQTMLIASLLNTERCISNFWKLEALGITDPTEVTTRQDLEAAAKIHFLETVKVNAEGRYEVHLPWLDGHPALATNKVLAERRLVSATNKLLGSGHFEAYHKVFKEWLEEGIIEEVPNEEAGNFGHYLPHRAVIKASSSTTKVRPVFDASAHEKNMPCLNECLEKGPNLIEDIPIIIIRFREKRIGVVADIAKAFLQLSLARKDRDFLRFLWWEDCQRNKIVLLRHKRVVFGVSSSPFLLGAAIQLHLDSAPEELKCTAKLLKTSFYVDNVATSLDNAGQLQKFKQEAQDLMALGKFDLRAWENTAIDSGTQEVKAAEVPLLGLIWDKVADTLRCEAISDFAEGPVTKRKILSVAQKIFDPIGFSCPVTLHPKFLLQLTWETKCGWDAELPPEISTKFQKWAKELHLLPEVKVPRWIFGSNSEKCTWSIHTFSDASKNAYAASVFVRAVTLTGVNVQLVLAKSRVAPLKALTIPRLELLSCLIGVRLTTVVKHSFDLQNAPTYYWTDSATALRWIQRDVQWGTFVGNRVKEIRSCTEVSQWNHVPGSHNPADLPSRGCSVKQLVESRWWEGPDWLSLSENLWPISHVQCNEEEVNAERKKTVVSMLSTSTGWSTIAHIFQDTTSYKTIIRRTAWFVRFFKWIKEKKPMTPVLTVQELEYAERIILKSVQKEAFTNRPEHFQKGTATVLENGLLCVQTRITSGGEPFQFKCPVLIPSNHPIVTYLVQEAHQENSHAGVQVLMANLRERYWIVRSRRTIRSVLNKCVRCQRFAAKRLEAAPAPLPLDRIRMASIFEVSGVDLAGPLFLKGGQKAWIVLYTCAVYRAMHLELVSSLSTEAFLQSFRRFIPRRGRPGTIYSDNGTNFVGSENMFRHLDWKKIETYATAKRVQWKFNPPTAAWWGGWWERMVRMVKQLLRRVLGKSSLNYEELVTILCDCEGVINSRPLTYVSEDMNDLRSLSPSVFLHELRESGVADIDRIDHESLNKRWQYRQRLREEFRKRFRVEYLGQLVQRAGAKAEFRKIVVGDIVLVGSDNVKRMDWPLAKVLEIMPGKDGHVRVVRVKTAVGELLRPIQRIYPLEVGAYNAADVLVPVSMSEELSGDKKDESEKGDGAQKTVEKIIRTRGGRVVKVPVRFAATNISLFAACEIYC